MDLTHVVATRVGVGIYDEAWYANRLPLFESITLPSMVAQTERRFTWLLFVDREMPPNASMQLTRLIEGHDWIIKVPVEMKIDVQPEFQRWVRAHARGQIIATSRLDDDDALRTDGIEQIQREADSFARTPCARGLVTFTIGTMWAPSEMRGYSRYHDSIGLGLTVFERGEDIRTVHGWAHRRIKPRIATAGGWVRSLGGHEPMWLYTAHALSSSESGEMARVERCRTHKHSYSMDSERLSRFGVDAGYVASLDLRPAVLKYGGPKGGQWVNAFPIERELRAAREALREAEGEKAERLASEIERLEQARFEAGSGFVKSPPGGGRFRLGRRWGRQQDE